MSVRLFLGDYNPDVVFENIKSILIMLINYPMTLANPSADMHEDKSSIDSSMTKRQTFTRNDSTQCQKNFGSEVDNQPVTVPRYQITSQLPSCVLRATECPETNSKEILVHSVIVEENNSVKSEQRKSNVTNKILEYLNSSSGEGNPSSGPVKRLSKKILDSRHSSSTSSTDGEIVGKSTIPEVKARLKNYNKPHTRSKEHQLGSSLLVGQTQSNYDVSAQQDKKINDQSDNRTPSKTGQNMPEISTTHASSNFNASIGPASCVDPRPTIASNGQPPRNSIHPSCSSSDNGLLRRGAQEPLSSNFTAHAMPENQAQQYNSTFGQSSFTTDITSGPMHGASHPSLSLSSSPKVIEQTCLSPNFTDQELKGILGKDVQRRNDGKSQIHDLLSETGGKHFQFQPSPCIENTSSQCTTSSSCSFGPILNVEKVPEEMLPSLLSSQEVNDKPCPLQSGKQAMPIKLPHNSLHENHLCSEKPVKVDREIKSMPLAYSMDDNSMELSNQRRQYTYPPLQGGLNTRAYSLFSTNQTLVEQPAPCTSVNDNFQHNEEFACAKGQNTQQLSEQRKDWFKQACQTSFRVSQLYETAATNNGYDFSSRSHRALGMDEIGAQVSKDDTIHYRNLLPDCSLPSPSSRNATKVVNDLPRKSRNEVYSSNYAVQSQKNSSPNERTINSHGLPSENSKLDPQAQNTNLSPPAWQLFDSFRRQSSDPAPFSDKKGLSPGRRILAPSFSFSSSTKDGAGKISNLPTDMTVKTKSKKIDDIMVNDSTIVGISRNDVWKSTFDISEVDFGIDENDGSGSSISGPAFESAKNIQDFSCPSDDIEIVKLKVNQSNLYSL